MKLQFKRFFSVDSPKAIKAKSSATSTPSITWPRTNQLALAICARMPLLAASRFALAVNLAKRLWCRPRPIGPIPYAILASVKRATSCKQRQEYMVEMLHHIAAACRTAKRKRIKLAFAQMAQPISPTKACAS